MAEDVLPNKELPLAGVILCCTSILPELRTELAAIATEMGAIHKFDLTSDVTHLIVGDTNTPKYKYVAKERSDVKVLRPEWVEAVRSSWLLGGDTNLEALEEEYKLPALAGLSICLTGFEDMNLRNGLQKTVTANGAEFRRDLTKSVTHLIARSGDGQKYKFAVMWNIKVVSLKWLEDSLERGMVLDESLYDPLLPSEKQGIGAWNRTAPTIPEKRPRHHGTNLQRPRKLRRVASSKLGGQNEGLWSDIVGDASGGSRQEEAEKELEVANALPVANPRPALQAEKSFASETTVSVRPGITPGEAPAEHRVGQASRGIWFGASFFITGFSTDQTRILKQFLASRDATIVQSINDLSQGNIISGEGANAYILVPYNLPTSKVPSIGELEIEAYIVTDMWIEKCLHNNAFVPPESHITSTPLPRYPIPEFDGMRICSTGFTGIDLLHLSKLVKLIGATYDEYLTPKASVLICNTTEPNSEKLRHVFEWNIPAVMADWLWISVQTGEKKHFEPYLINKKQRLQPKPPPNPREPPGEAFKNQGPPTEKSSNVPERRPVDGPRLEARDDNAWTDDRGHDKQSSNTLKGVSSHSRSKSRSLSPTKHDSGGPPSKSVPTRTSSTGPTESSNRPTLNAALNELLKQKRESSKAPASGAEDNPNPGPKKRRRLFGRANSHASTHSTATATGTANQQKGFSRASSIDTMNEDGYGSVVEGLDSASNKGNSFASALTNNNPDKSEAQQLLESRLDMFRKQNSRGETGFEEEEDEPAMTQLGYEDPDAAAMREKFSSQTDKSKGDKDGAVGKRLPAVTKLKDHAVLDGWGGGRRTRRAEKPVPFWE